VSRLRRVSGRETIAAPERLGFIQVRQRGSHVVLRKKGTRGDVGCVVPLHKELAVGTLHNILKLAQVTEEEFIENI
jgi:predicted RNA binding protein YcfA (HicA-like mRNA interferase family)